ncbi:hypothetical protein [Streptomyces youssoufiensis]
MQRSEDGRKWFAGYMKAPAARRPAADHPVCPDHQVRMTRVLGRAWICRACTRQTARTDPPAAE